jgi:hypothetical protein
LATDVIVLDNGELQITCDGQALAPLPVEAIEAAHARIPDAQNAVARVQLTAAIRALTDVLLTQGADMTASVEVTPAGLTAVVDSGSYEAVRQQLGVTPDGDGQLVWGPAVVTAVPDPVPDPQPEP